MKLSVIIPTHNPRMDYFERVIQALANQTLHSQLWELIIVDNASEIPLTSSLKYPLSREATIVREERAGLSYARAAGFRESSGDVLIFCDDDNILSPHYLATAMEVMEFRSEIGACGGIIEPSFEAKPLKWALPHLGSLALRNLGNSECFVGGEDALKKYPAIAPLGAGMVIRRACFASYEKWRAMTGSAAIGRQGRSLSSCEECDLLVAGVFHEKYGVSYDPRLQIQHLIPKGRLRFNYLVRLIHEGAISWSQFLIRHNYETSIPKWTVPIRTTRAFFRCRGWSRSGYLSWRKASGYFKGRAA